MRRPPCEKGTKLEARRRSEAALRKLAEAGTRNRAKVQASLVLQYARKAAGFWSVKGAAAEHASAKKTWKDLDWYPSASMMRGRKFKHWRRQRSLIEKLFPRADWQALLSGGAAASPPQGAALSCRAKARAAEAENYKIISYGERPDCPGAGAPRERRAS